MNGVHASDLLRRPVRLHGIQLGRPVDVVLDRECRRVLGLEVLCGDDERRFLPFAAAALGPDDLAIRSPLLLLEPAELAFYTTRGSTLRALRGQALARDGMSLGTLDDLVLDADGVVTALVVESPTGRREVPAGDALSFVSDRRARAAVS